jgi:hypothetical protein
MLASKFQVGTRLFYKLKLMRQDELAELRAAASNKYQVQLDAAQAQPTTSTKQAPQITSCILGIDARTNTSVR